MTRRREVGVAGNRPRDLALDVIPSLAIGVITGVAWAVPRPSIGAVVPAAVVMGAALVGARTSLSRQIGRTATTVAIVALALAVLPAGGALAAVAGAEPRFAQAAVFALLLVLGGGLARFPMAWLRERYGAPRGLRALAAGGTCSIALVLALGAAEAADPALASIADRSTLTGAAATGAASSWQLLLRGPRGGNGLVVSSVATDDEERAFYHLKLPPGSTVELDATAESDMLARTNRARRAAGLSPLRPDPALQRAAREHSADMYRRNYLSHQTPDQVAPYERMRRAGAAFQGAGENVVLAPDVGQSWDLLITSPSHRANIVNPSFQCVGIGAYRGVAGEMVTQDFSDCAGGAS